jgi:hypothetical protein
MTAFKGAARSGQPCRMAPLRDSGYCWTHDPAKARERAEARQRGGRNRRTPGSVIASLGVGVAPPAGLSDMASIQAGLDLVWRDTLAQENSGSRSRTLVAVLLAAVKCLGGGRARGAVDGARVVSQSTSREGSVSLGKRVGALEQQAHRPDEGEQVIEVVCVDTDGARS